MMIAFSLYGHTYVLAQAGTLLVCVRECVARAAASTPRRGWDHDDGAHPGVYA